MDDRNPSPPPFSLSSGGGRRHAADEDGGDAAACTGKSCQSCTAGAIADCVALCCCPCAVVNCFVLAFFKLPWAVARKCLRRRRKRRRRLMLEERKCGGRDRDGISEKGWADGGMFEIVVSAAVGEEAEECISAEEVWLELSEIGHLGFGRVSSARINFYSMGN
ncbi:hypothetical protein C2S52_002613 [Perilla frutescens var. hirtella]|uniref:Uncharacterized protein n=1 Tax=Perilla frutescens var. hirtella TaxID=608512 RepID=A0AAD4JAZ1_PERFH|nr:hypothetical protein C2S52_002613 [Perilla frutescens var. hirtella]KAH6830465.1 hypothetical protein C2S53_008936 [Perilla frutescens var. hirtella]